MSQTMLLAGTLLGCFNALRREAPDKAKAFQEDNVEGMDLADSLVHPDDDSGNILPLYYVDDSNRMREVGAFVKPESESAWLFHSRGTAQAADTALRHERLGYLGGLGSFNPEDVRIVLDQPVCEEGKDKPNFSWNGPQLTVAEFHAWFEEVSHGV